MKIIFTSHARKRMQEREILEKEVIECVLRSDRIIKDDIKVNRFQKLFSGGILEVVGKYKGTHLIVITVYPL